MSSLTITYNNKIYTDNSQDLIHDSDQEVVFVVSKQNEKYLSSVKQTDVTIVESKDLIDHIDLKDINSLKKIFESSINILKNYKRLPHRYEILGTRKGLTFINDSKSTSFASSENLLKNLDYAYWILGGIPKKGDQLKRSKKHCKNFKVLFKLDDG